jgi:16S rRNA (cytosine967-C5)-methyltransferase
VAARVIQRVARGRSLSEVLPEELESVDPADRPLVQELCYGVLRWWLRLQGIKAALLSRPLKSRDGDVEALLLVGIYQLLYMRVPPHAALDETVEATRRLRKAWAVPLVNGVLRGFQRRKEELLPGLDETDYSRLSTPQWLLERVRRAWPEQWQAILEAFNQHPPLTLRVNLSRCGRRDYSARLGEQGLAARPVASVPSALVLDRPVDVGSLPGFAEGLVSVQDAGAQLAAGLLDLRPGQLVLDACAAPGGKSGHILESAVGIHLTAVDLDAKRLARVRENLDRLEMDAELVAGDAARPEGSWAETPYDRILLDVPCSATGVVRRHPDIKLLRRESDIPDLVRRQGEILSRIWPLLRPGGMLVYATCSLLPEENELQVERFLAGRADVKVRPIEADWGHARSLGRQTLPGEDSMDGFYYACLEKS